MWNPFSRQQFKLRVVMEEEAQFTSHAFTGVLKRDGIVISMDGRGRVFDNIFVERLWRNVKYEDVYLKGYATMGELLRCIAAAPAQTPPQGRGQKQPSRQTQPPRQKPKHQQHRKPTQSQQRGSAVQQLLTAA